VLSVRFEVVVSLLLARPQLIKGAECPLSSRGIWEHAPPQKIFEIGKLRKTISSDLR